MIKRTFSIEPDVDAYLQKYGNRSKAVNAIIKRHIRLQHQEQMVEAYKQMNRPEALEEFRDWEQATLLDGLEDQAW